MTFRSAFLLLTGLLLLGPNLVGCATAPAASSATPEMAEPSADPKPEAATKNDSRPSIAKVTKGLERHDGLFPLYPDPATGKLWMELPAPGDDGVIAEVLWLEGLVTGLGSNPVGLDRGQMSESRVLDIRRVGPRVVFVQPNLKFVARSEDPGERLATRQSFAQSVLWGAEIGALDDDGRSLVDLTPFVVRDAHGVSRTLQRTEQGQYQLDASRSYLDFSQVLAFPDNLEFEAVLTWANQGGKPPGELVRGTAPDGDTVTLVQYQSLVRLPDDGYRPRLADPRMGFWHDERYDYAAPLDESLSSAYIGRHRLHKADPTARVSEVVEPIVYYVDHGAPSRSARRCSTARAGGPKAFEAAGFVDAFRVEVLPEGVHPLDVRYNVIQWVHRSTRGWSYGGASPIRAPARSSRATSPGLAAGAPGPLLFEGLAGHREDRQRRRRRSRRARPGADPPAVGPRGRAHARLTHNFAASTYADRASVMDYPAPLVTVGEEGGLDSSRAYGVGVGAWDVHAIRWGYSEFAPGPTRRRSWRRIVREGLDAGCLFLSDGDARPPHAADPRANLWDNGDDAVEALESSLAVRAHALARFGERNLPEGAPLAHLQEVLAPLYFHHRYQLDAAAKTLGGVEYHYALRGDGQQPTSLVDSARQRRALDVVLSILDTRTLDLPESVLELLAPRPFGEDRNREMFGSRTAPSFDALGAAATAADMAVRSILQPGRLARLEDHHRRHRNLPSVAEVMERLLNAAFAEESSARRAAIRRQVESVTVAALLELAAHPEAAPGVRAEAEFALAEAAHRLTRDEANAHADRLRLEIERFLERPWQAREPVAVDAPPPGSPIGSTLGGRSDAFGSTPTEPMDLGACGVFSLR